MLQGSHGLYPFGMYGVPCSGTSQIFRRLQQYLISALLLLVLDISSTCLSPAVIWEGRPRKGREKPGQSLLHKVDHTSQGRDCAVISHPLELDRGFENGQAAVGPPAASGRPHKSTTSEGGAVTNPGLHSQYWRLATCPLALPSTCFLVAHSIEVQLQVTSRAAFNFPATSWYSN